MPKSQHSPQYTAVVKEDGGWWIGWIEEVPGVNCQERSREELLETLRITLRELLDLNRESALAAAGDGFTEVAISP
jgi:predicted RNase H-like HicB family nuclease